MECSVPMMLRCPGCCVAYEKSLADCALTRTHLRHKIASSAQGGPFLGCSTHPACVVLQFTS